VLSAIARFLEGIAAIISGGGPAATATMPRRHDDRWWIPHKAAPAEPIIVLEPKAPTPPVVAPAAPYVMEPVVPDFVTRNLVEPGPPKEAEADGDADAIPAWDDEAFAEFLETHRKAKEGTSVDPRFETVEIPRTMELSEEAYAIARDWQDEHRAVHPLPANEVFGQYWIRFSRSSLGDTAVIGCSTCGDTKIVTELEAPQAPEE
jgi:hypothetical protein